MGCCEDKRVTGYTPKTAENFQIDSGVYYKNYIVGVDTPATAKAKIIGATQGGGTIAFTPTYRQALVDGVQGDARDVKRILFWEAVITANMVEIDADMLKDSLAAVDVTTDEFYSKYSARHSVCSADYIENITFIGIKAGTCDPLVVQINNALNRNGFNLTSVDAAEGIVPLELKGHYNPESPGAVPFTIWNPTRTEGGIIEGIVTENGEPVEGAEVWIEVV